MKLKSKVKQYYKAILVNVVNTTIMCPWIWIRNHYY